VINGIVVVVVGGIVVVVVVVVVLVLVVVGGLVVVVVVVVVVEVLVVVVGTVGAVKVQPARSDRTPAARINFDVVLNRNVIPRRAWGSPAHPGE
jgi:hypothetical protein